VASESDFDALTEFDDPLVTRARGRAGTVIHGKWRLDVLLGVGGMGAVYSAQHRNGQRVAVKILHPELSLRADLRTRFLRESRAVNAVGHDGCVRMLSADTAEDGSLFIVMELLDGETLEERRMRLGGCLDEDEVLSVADQVLDVLIAAHGKLVFHRDVKPGNIFLTRAGQVRLLDFGIARLREATSKSTATKSGATMGTPAFMSPEQARGLWDEVDGRSDLWAVGATMFDLLTGRVVHEGRTANEQLLHAMTKEPPLLESVLPNASPAVCHLVNRALAFEKDRRWPNASRMQVAVRQAYYDRYASPITTSPRLVVPETVRNRTLANSQAGAVAPRLPTTGQPVETSPETRAVPGIPRAHMAWAKLPGHWQGAILLVCVATLGLAVLAVGWIVSAVVAPTDDGSASEGLVGVGPSASSAPAPTPTVSPTPTLTPTPAPAPMPTPKVTPTATPSEQPSWGYLNINSIPSSSCFVDGEPVGSTPMTHWRVKPGKHRVKFVFGCPDVSPVYPPPCSGDGPTKTITVYVGAGETMPAGAKLAP
jgi:eukaryotic-like serine/threonine-protein kinase